MRIVQVLDTLAPGDAIGNDVMALVRLFGSWGWDADIAVRSTDPRVSHLATRFDDYDWESLGPEDLTIFHHSIGTSLVDKLACVRGRRILLYHNITPSHFFAGINPEVEKQAGLGRQQLSKLKELDFEATVSDSSFNMADLAQVGFTNNHVIPIFMDLEGLRAVTPDPQVLSCYGDRRTTWLFVGRVAPNKRQDDLIRVFEHYQRCIDPGSRLLLVGGGGNMEVYVDRLGRLIEQLELSGNVVLSGQVSPEQLVAYFRCASVFVCMSDHEGFCVPLAESMYFDIPIVAYAAGSIPETLGGAGILVRAKEPAIVSEIVHLAVTDEALRDRLIARQRQRLADFEPAIIGLKWQALLSELARPALSPSTT